MNRMDDILSYLFQFAIVSAIIGIVAYVGVCAWIAEDNARIEHLRIHKQSMVERQVR